jgi:pimeloyl-ACP methyl ester carboxylesterase
MERLIKNMMNLSGVSEQELKGNHEIATSMGETLYWDYYCYVKDNPICTWNVPTSILYGSEDTMTEFGVVEGFTERFNCDLTVLVGSEHWFHTEQQLAFLSAWIEGHINV